MLAPLSIRKYSCVFQIDTCSSRIFESRIRAPAKAACLATDDNRNQMPFLLSPFVILKAKSKN
jgi:hypothetical protein